MGMSASQARFLTLTARKTNTEYEGQQINQQRTALSNESSNYYSQLTSMVVPTPPSSSDYSRITYTFVNGTELNTITSLIATANTGSTGVYKINYTQEIPGDSMVVSGTAQVSRTPVEDADPKYFIGADELQAAYTISEDSTEGAGYEAVTATTNPKDDGLYEIKYVSTTDTSVQAGKTYYSDANGNTPVDRASGNPSEAGYYEKVYVLTDDTTKDNSKTYYKKIESNGASGSEDVDAMRQHFIKAGIPAGKVNTMTDDTIKAKAKLEAQYDSMMKAKYGDGDYMVLYRQTADEKSYEPVFFSKAELERFDYNLETGLSLGGLKKYEFGQETEVREIKNREAKVEQDSSGRYISIFLYDKDSSDGAGTRYDLTTNTEADEKGYNDAMNQYYYDKAVYDQKVQEINAKIEIIQVQDKNLELKLKQLDTEQNAIQTEMDAVKKVISKNVESSFKTFNA